MMYSTVHMTTFTCDIPWCGTQQTVGGDEPLTMIEEMEWTIGHPFFLDTHKDLCPFHTKELKSWLTGDESDVSDPSDRMTK